MANISSFYGTMTISEKALSLIRKDLAVYVKNFVPSYYGIEDYEVSASAIMEAEGNLEIPFYGNGRWSYYSMLTGKYGTLENQTILRKLWNSWDEDCWIKIEYSDYEPGCCVLYSAEGFLYPERDEGMFVLAYNETSYNEPLYNIPNLIEMNFVEAEYDVRDDKSLEYLLKDLINDARSLWCGDHWYDGEVIMENKDAIKEFVLNHKYYCGYCSYYHITELLNDLEEAGLVELKEE